ncbi:hypothetical protein FOA52_013069 [Chlamydomonas sp. UWO 241]|nr:hypothetical protein FOA52_013069 [Chlamydomonas sp. UWO 241]
MARMSKELSVDIDDCFSKVRQKCHNVRCKTRRFLKSEKFKEQLVAELKVEVDFRDAKPDWTPMTWTTCTKGRKKVVGWVNGNGEYPRSGSGVSEGDCMFLVVPGCDTHSVPEFVAIVRAHEGVSIESGMSMVPMRFEFVYAKVAFELCALAADGMGAMAVDAIDWSAVTACPLPHALLRGTTRTVR